MWKLFYVKNYGEFLLKLISGIFCRFIEFSDD